MKIYSSADLAAIEDGDIMLLYGETGVGKSVSVIQTAVDPIFHFLTEPRNPAKFLKAAQRPDVEIDFAFYTDWEDMFQFFLNPSQLAKYQTVVIDSLTFLSNVNLSFEIEDEAYAATSTKSKDDKPLISRTKLSQEGYGGLSGQMLRFTNAITKLSQQGKTVIMLALLEQNPRFNRELVGAPALKGKEFPKALPGFCDFIGLVEHSGQIDASTGLTKYPPRVRFTSDGGYLCKWTGYPGKGAGPLNIKKILDVAHGRN